MDKFISFSFKVIWVFLSVFYTAILPFSGLQGLTLEEQPLHGSVTVTAHSGCIGLPDNSVVAMEAGVAAGAQIVEFDLNFRADGTPVLSHNDPGDSDCATLADAFAFLAAHPCVKANVDVKSTAYIDKVQPMAEAAGVLEQLFFTGLDETTIPIAAEACPAIPYYLNVKETEGEDFAALAEKTIALGAMGVNLNLSKASTQLVRAMHERGLLVSLWTIEDGKEALRALRMGVDNVTTYRPALVRLVSPVTFRALQPAAAN